MCFVRDRNDCSVVSQFELYLHSSLLSLKVSEACAEALLDLAMPIADGRGVGERLSVGQSNVNSDKSNETSSESRDTQSLISDLGVDVWILTEDTKKLRRYRTTHGNEGSHIQ